MANFAGVFLRQITARAGVNRRGYPSKAGLHFEQGKEGREIRITPAKNEVFVNPRSGETAVEKGDRRKNRKKTGKHRQITSIASI